MAKKQRGRNSKFWKLYYYLKEIRHPYLRKKPMPSHAELLAVGVELFGIPAGNRTRNETIDLIWPHLPGTVSGAVGKKNRKKSKTGTMVSQKMPAGIGLSAKQVAFIVSDAFLESYEWRRLRYQVLKKHDGLCEVCGRGRPHGQVLNIDHIKCRRKYPELALDIKNLQVLCGDCNHGKGNWDDTDWRNRRPANTPEEREWEREAWERFDKF